MPCFAFDNTTLHYREHRERKDQAGNGSLLVILPGNTASSASHLDELAFFGQEHHAVALDYLGTGQSDRLDRWETDWWFQGARQAANLVQHLGYQNCIAMGTSGGGITALLMAIHFPDMVRAVIADSCVERFSPDGLRAEAAMRDHAPGELAAFWEQAHGEDWREVVRSDSALLNRMADQGGDCFGGRLGAIGCPVLLTASRADSFLPDVEEQLHNMHGQIRHSRLLLDDTGDHPLMWTRPDIFRREAQDFLAELAS